jgi:hypothetical protein
VPSEKDVSGWLGPYVAIALLLLSAFASSYFKRQETDPIPFGLFWPISIPILSIEAVQHVRFRRRNPEPCSVCDVCYCGDVHPKTFGDAGHSHTPMCWSWRTGDLQCPCRCHVLGSWMLERARRRIAGTRRARV